MDCTLRSRRRRSRPQPEALEGRALLANAGALDPSFGIRGQVAVPLLLNATDQYSQVAGSAVDSSGRVLFAAT